MSVPSECIFLSPDERFEVWAVKAAERPELLEVHGGEGVAEEVDEDDSSPTTVPPLSDGCDIPGWRSRGIALGEPMIDSDNIAILQNVGAGSTLLRRENCLPVSSTFSQAHKSPWKDLRESLSKAKHIPEHHRADRICQEEAQEHPLPHERENRPVVIEGFTEKWKAMESCKFDQLVERFGDMEWRFSDTHAEGMTLRTYQKYVHSLEGTSDDAPLAVYDSQFGTDVRKEILDEYQVPSCFDADLFSLMDSIERDADDTHATSNDSSLEQNDSDSELEDPLQNRPPFRWILIGPERSGTGMHVDPVGTFVGDTICMS